MYNLMWYVYVLKSLKDGNYYIGQTNDLKKRIDAHNKGIVHSTKSRRPFILIGSKELNSQKEARWIEYQVKHHSDKKKKLLKSLNK